MREAYRMRWKRKRLLWRSFRSRHQLTSVVDKTRDISPRDVLLFVTIRNEIDRLEEFLEYYRTLGVRHFLVVDNGSDDGSAELLQAQQDVSLWVTHASYRQSRFGVDWLTWLQIKYGHKHWCLTVDADEFLVFSGYPAKDLNALTAHLDQQEQRVFGALMLDMYPDGPIGQADLSLATWFDAAPYRSERQRPLMNLWVQGGARERVFFQSSPEQSPTLNKLPLVKWNRRYAYVNSTHSILPPRLNLGYDGPGDKLPCGVLLHKKFDRSIVSKSETERLRGEHFGDPSRFVGYYDQIVASPNMWNDASVRYEDPEQLVKLGLMSQINW